MGRQINVPALFAQGRKIGDGGLGAGDDDELRLDGDRLPPPHENQPHAGFGLQRIEIVEIGNARQLQHRDGDGGLAGRVPLVQRQRILRWQARCVRKVRDQPQRGPGRPLRDGLQARLEQGGIAAKAVDQKARHQRRVVRRDHHLRAHDLRDDPAPVDVPEHDDRHIGGAGEAHVGDVVGAQVDLRSAPRALYDHQIRLLPQALETLEHRAHEAGFQGLIIPRVGGPRDLALHHDLRADHALGLQQHRVHMHAGGGAAGPGLKRLRPADLAAIRRHRRIVGHVLRLEGPHAQAAIAEDTTKPGDDKRFADVRTHALDHEGLAAPGAQNSIPSCAFTPAAKWCFTATISVTRSAASINSGFALRPVTTTCRSARRALRVSTTCASGR